LSYCPVNGDPYRALVGAGCLTRENTTTYRIGAINWGGRQVVSLTTGDYPFHPSLPSNQTGDWGYLPHLWLSR